MFLGGLALGFIAGCAASLATLFIAGQLRGHGAAPPEWIDTGRWDDASSATRP